MRLLKSGHSGWALALANAIALALFFLGEWEPRDVVMLFWFETLIISVSGSLKALVCGVRKGSGGVFEAVWNSAASTLLLLLMMYFHGLFIVAILLQSADRGASDLLQ